MLKKALTLAIAIVAVGGALAGNANARNLLVAQGWVDAESMLPISEGTAIENCPGDETSCAYYFANEGDTEPELTLHKDRPVN